MPSSITLYNNFKRFGQEDLHNNEVKLLLVTSAYTFSALHDVLADVLTSPSPEVASGDGYTTGGEVLASKTITLSDSPSQAVFDAANVTFTALTKTFRYGILYINATIDGMVKPVMACLLFDTTPADIVVSGVDWTVQWSPSGILKIA